MSKLNNTGNQEEIEKIKELAEIVKGCTHDQVADLITILKSGNGLVEIPADDDKLLTAAGIDPERVREEERKRGMTATSVIIDTEGRKRITWNFE